MFRKLFLMAVAAAIVMVGAGAAVAQDAASLAAALDKNKYKNKQKSKNGVDMSVETYLDIKNIPAVKQPAEYSGNYRDESGCSSLELRVAADGSAQGDGSETVDGNGKDNQVRFTLRNGRVSGAVLSADKVFADGRTERIEAVFVNRTTLQGKNEKDIETRNTQFGLGYVQKYDQSTNRVFLARN